MGEYDLQFTVEDMERYFDENRIEGDKTIVLAHHLIAVLQGILGVSGNLCRGIVKIGDKIERIHVDPLQKEYLEEIVVLTKKHADATRGMIATVDPSWGAEPRSFDDYHSTLEKLLERYPVLPVLEDLSPLIEEQKNDLTRLENFTKILCYHANSIFSPDFQQDFFFLIEQYNNFVINFMDAFKQSKIWANVPGTYGGERIQTSEDYFTKALDPLIWNAYEHAFNPENDIFNRKDERFVGTIWLTTEPDEENQEIFITLGDNGFGVRPKIAKNIFKRGASTKLKGEIEHGIGLWGAKQFVEQQGGRIWFETELGRGTKFYFTIPYTRKEDFLYIQD